MQSGILARIGALFGSTPGSGSADAGQATPEVPFAAVLSGAAQASSATPVGDPGSMQSDELEAGDAPQESLTGDVPGWVMGLPSCILKQACPHHAPENTDVAGTGSIDDSDTRIGASHSAPAPAVEQPDPSPIAEADTQGPIEQDGKSEIAPSAVLRLSRESESAPEAGSDEPLILEALPAAEGAQGNDHGASPKSEIVAILPPATPDTDAVISTNDLPPASAGPFDASNGTPMEAGRSDNSGTAQSPHGTLFSATERSSSGSPDSGGRQEGQDDGSKDGAAESESRPTLNGTPHVHTGSTGAADKEAAAAGIPDAGTPEMTSIPEREVDALAGLLETVWSGVDIPDSTPPPGQPPASLRGPAVAAWLHRVLGTRQHQVAVIDGWQVMEMKLDGERGDVEVRTRRDEARVTVSVNFSDPALASQMQASAPRIEQILQTQYAAAVSLSFNTGAERQAQDDKQTGRDEPSGREITGRKPTDELRMSRTRTKAQGAVREWIG